MKPKKVGKYRMLLLKRSDCPKFGYTTTSYLVKYKKEGALSRVCSFYLTGQFNIDRQQERRVYALQSSSGISYRKDHEGTEEAVNALFKAMRKFEQSIYKKADLTFNNF